MEDSNHPTVDLGQSFKTLLEHSPDATIAIDAAGRVTYYSPAVKDLGYNATELKGRNLLELVHESDRDSVALTLEKLLSGEINHGREEFRFLAGNGEWRHVEAVGVRHEAGSFKGALVVGRDVTATRRMMTSLQETSALFRTVFETSRNLVSITDPASGRFIEVNQRWLEVTGFTREEVIGRTANELGIWGKPENRERLTHLLDQQGQISNFEATGFGKNHRKFRVIADASLVMVEDQPRLLLSAEDVTERHQIEEQLRQSQKMEAMGHLTGGVAHDFNNILNVILGYASLLEGGSDQQQYIDEIIKACTRGGSLTRQLLAFSRKQELTPEPTDLQTLLDDVMSVLRQTLPSNISLTIDPEDALRSCLVDADQMKTTIINLAINARDAMPEGGNITIALRNITVTPTPAMPAQGEYVEICVTDTGEGIPEHELGKVFEPFFTTKPEGKGTGLGLSMVFGFIKQSGGFIDIESEVGKGTTVRMLLPPVQQTESSHSTDGRSRAMPSAGGERILLVEDEQALLDVVQQQLEQAGYEVIAAASVDEAKDKIRNLDVLDLVITDVMLTGDISGTTFARSLAKRWPELKTLFVSGYARDQITSLAEEDVLLCKPFTAATLRTTIGQLLGRA